MFSSCFVCSGIAEYILYNVSDVLLFSFYQAIDPTDDEAFITYRIVSGNTPTNSFVINRTSGELTLKETVSYEQTIDRKGQ